MNIKIIVALVVSLIPQIIFTGRPINMFERITLPDKDTLACRIKKMKLRQQFSEFLLREGTLSFLAEKQFTIEETSRKLNMIFNIYFQISAEPSIYESKEQRCLFKEMTEPDLLHACFKNYPQEISKFNLRKS